MWIAPPKALEFLKLTVPDLKQVYLPFNPDDAVSVDYLRELNKTGSQVGVELILHEIHSVEEAVTAIENLKEDIDAVFMIPSPTLNLKNSELSRAAIKRKIPMGAALQLDEDVLITFSADFSDAGKKMARMAEEILEGKNPADIPVETMEVKLIINLKTAEKIGILIPDGILVQADTIIR